MAKRSVAIGAADQRRGGGELDHQPNRPLHPLDGRREAPDRKRVVIRSGDGAARSVRAIGCWTALSTVALWILAVPNSLPAQTLTAGSAAGLPGQTVWFNVTLDPQYISVAATMNTIEFNAVHTPVKQCQQASGLNKTIAHALLPSPCGGAGQPLCSKVRVIVMDPVDRAPEGILVPTVLYQCRVDIPPGAAPGQYPLIMGGASASDPAGNPKALAVAHGTIVVLPPGGGGCAVITGNHAGHGWVVGIGLLLGLAVRSWGQARK